MPDFRFTDRWNEAVLENSRTSDLAMALHRKAAAEGIYYRIPASLVRDDQNLTFWHPEMPQAQTAAGECVMGLVPNFPITPGFLTADEEVKLRRLGEVLHKVVAASKELMLTDPLARRLIGRSERVSEMHAFDTDPGYRDPLMMRLDYVWRQANGEQGNSEWEPALIDINLLPGFIVLTFDFLNLYEELLESFAPYLWESVQPSGLGHLHPLAEAMKQAYLEWKAKHPWDERGARVAHAVREAHGLEPEQRRWVKVFQRLAPELWDSAEVVYPYTVENGGWSAFPLIFRQVREYWGRSALSTSYTVGEEHGISKLIEGYRSGKVCCFPPFALWQEDHQWFYFYRRCAGFYSALLGEEDYRWFRSLVPRTSIVDEKILITEEGEVPLDANVFREGVLKRGDSTSARDLTIITKGSGGQRRGALEYCQSHWHEGLVWQEFVRPSKLNPVALNPLGVPFQFPGFAKYAAYFVDGRYLGGNVMIAQGSKVHGGRGTLLGPVYTVMK